MTITEVEKKRLGEKIDTFFNKTLPKKFIVFSVGTIFAFMNIIDGMQWTIIAGAYLGVNVAQKLTGKKL